MRVKQKAIIILLFGVLFTLHSGWMEPVQEGLIWWEAEDFKETSFLLEGFEATARHWAAGEKPYLLSGKDSLPILIGRPADDERGWFAKYEVDVQIAGKYYFWLRAWPITRSSAPFEFRFNKEDWRRIDEGTRKVDVVAIGSGFRQVAWLYGGTISLPKGEHTFIVKQLKGEQNYIQNYDCFMLTLVRITPQGIEKPRFELEEEEEEEWD